MSRERLVDPTSSADEFDRIEPRTTWIWGSPRSGSSWLLDLLGHPARVARDDRLGFVLSEPGRPTRVIPADEPSFGHHFAPFEQPICVDGQWMPGSIINGSEGRPTYLLAREHSVVWKPWLRGLILSRLAAVRAEAAANGLADPDAAIVVKETPSGHAADRVMGLLPRSRAILIVRDPRDVVDSLASAFAPGGFMAEQFGVTWEGAERAEGIAWAAKTWAMSMDVGRNALEAHDPSLGRTVRYEDLLGDPAPIVAELTDWIGVGRDRSEVEAAVSELSFSNLPADDVGERKRRRSARPSAWRENLSSSESNLVEEIVGDRIELYGYERLPG